VILDKSHRPWIVTVVLLTIAAAAIYVPYARGSVNGPSGSSAIGLSFGIAGAALMAFAGLLGARKKLPVWRLGRAQTWLTGHVWLGLLAVPLILFHAGFSFGGPLTTILMILLLAEVASGIFGLALQQYLPRLMLERLPRETIYDELEHRIERLAIEAYEMVASVAGDLPVRSAAGALQTGRAHKPVTARTETPGSAPLREFYLEHVRGLLDRGRPQGPLADEVDAKRLFRELRAKLPASLLETAGEIEDLCRERREYELQRRMHHWLHGWLYVHVPISAALLVLGGFHAVMALKF
jgi:hypothetical protein